MPADSSLKILSPRLLLVSSRSGGPRRNTGSVEDITHPSFSLQPVWNPRQQCASCVSLWTFGLSYFWFILLLAYPTFYSSFANNLPMSLVRLYLQEHTSCFKVSIWTPLMVLLCILCRKSALWRAQLRVSSHSGQSRGLRGQMSGIQIQASSSYVTTRCWFLCLLNGDKDSSYPTGLLRQDYIRVHKCLEWCLAPSNQSISNSFLSTGSFLFFF